MLTGRLTKDSAELRRVTIDFSQWLDTNEQISAVSTPVIVVEQVQIWAQGQWVNMPPPQITDTTPLQVASIVTVPGNLQVQMKLAAGTPGLTYKLTFIATGSSSARQPQVDILVTVRMPI